MWRNSETIVKKIFSQQINIVRSMLTFNYNINRNPRDKLVGSEPGSSCSVIIDFNYTYRFVYIRCAHRPLCSFPHVERVHLRRPLLQWLEERGKKKSRQHNRANWYNIHLLLRVSMLHNVTTEGSRGMMGAKRDRERVAFKWRNAGGGGMRWGRWDSRMTLLVGDLYPLVEWPSSHGKIYRIFEVLS